MLGSHRSIGSLALGQHTGAAVLILPETSRYILTRNAIENELNVLIPLGLGYVFHYRPFPKSWKDYFDLYTRDNRLNVCFFSRKQGTDSPDSNDGYGVQDASEFIHKTRNSDQWSIELLYGHFNTVSDESEEEFHRLVERVENHFRFLQDLGGLSGSGWKVYRSQPLQRVYCDFWGFEGDVLCHRAEWTLDVVTRITNPATN